MEALLKTIEEKKALWDDDMGSDTFFAPLKAILRVHDEFGRDDKMILAKKIFSLLAEHPNSPHLTKKFLDAAKEKAQEVIRDVNILPEFQTIFGSTMCVASAKDGSSCGKVIPFECIGCSEHPVIRKVSQRGFPQFYPSISVDFSHFDLISRPLPSVRVCVNIIRSKNNLEIARLASDIQRMDMGYGDDYYTAMVEASITLGNLHALEIFWQSTYYYDRSSPHYSSDLTKAVRWGSFRTFKHVLSAFIHRSSVCPEEITYDELATFANPKTAKFLDTIPFTDELDGLTPGDLREWCGCKTCVSPDELCKLFWASLAQR